MILMSRDYNPTGKIKLAIGITSFLLLLGGNAAHAQYLYGITNGGTIYEVNPVLKSTTKVFNQNLTMSGANGLAWDEAHERLFYFGTVASTLRLYVWDRFTGVQTQVGGTLPAGQVTDGSFYNNAYWFVRHHSDTLVKINFNFSNPVSPLVSSFQSFTNFDGTATTDYTFGDISTRPSDGTLFGSSNKGLFKVKVSGATPSGYSLINANTPSYQIGFGQDNVLYAEAPTTGAWFTLNQTTGLATSLFYTSLDSQGNIITFNDISEAAIQGSAAPEPASFALIGFALPVVGLVRRRKA